MERKEKEMITDKQWDALFDVLEKNSDKFCYLIDVVQCSSNFFKELCDDEDKDSKFPVRAFKELIKSGQLENEDVDSAVDGLVLNLMFSLFVTYAASFLFKGNEEEIRKFAKSVGGTGEIRLEKKNLNEDKNLC